MSCGHSQLSERPDRTSGLGLDHRADIAPRMAIPESDLLHDHVFPSLPVRQWVLSLPKRLRYFLRNDRRTVTAVLTIFLRVVEQVLRERSAGAAPKARLGAVSFVHRFGSSLNQHVHFHCCVIDGVFEPDQGSNEAVRFREAVLTDADVQWVQARVRQRVLRWFVRQGYLDKDDAKDMARWSNGGGFSVDASVRVGADDRAGLEPVSPVSPTQLPHEYRFRVESHPSPELRQCPLSV